MGDLAGAKAPAFSLLLPQPMPTIPGDPRLRKAMYVRNFVFGGEDSLVSTVGLLSGVAAAGLSKGDIILSGTILIFVEALSMAVGSFLSENSAEEYLSKSELPLRSSITAGSIMFGSYFLLGFIPLLPYLLWPVSIAFGASIAASLLALTLLGWVSGRNFKVNAWHSGLKMLILGGLAIGIGIAVGQLIR
jgi:VIT1/CCC1 family predicted Fe2+/Mn2+ transporter